MRIYSAVGVGVVSALLLSLSAGNAALAQTATRHADYFETIPRPSLRQTVASFFRGSTNGGNPVNSRNSQVGFAGGLSACDMTCDCCDGTYPTPCLEPVCDGIRCDGSSCDPGYDGIGSDSYGYGSGSNAFCLLGGHDVPYDFSIDTLGLSSESCFDVGGWVQFGYVTQSDGQFNSNPNRFNNHQSWLYMGKRADGDLGLDWGFRIDALYGTDANNTQAFGNPPGRWDYQNGFDHGSYGFAMPQAYFEMAYQDLSVKVGHFFTLLGYEVVAAPDNFFFSHSFTKNHSEAFTHTGALATYRYDDEITLYGGWTEGWDTGFDRFNNGSNFLGGARMLLSANSSLSYITTLGDLGKIGDGYSHSIVLDVAVTDRLNYVFQSDLLHTNQSNSYGINQYVFYDVNQWLAAGARAEWWKSDGVSYYEVTAGVNIRPTGNFIIRPEARYQYSPAGNAFSGMTNPKNPAGLPLDQGTIFGIDAILTF